MLSVGLGRLPVNMTHIVNMVVIEICSEDRKRTPKHQ